MINYWWVTRPKRKLNSIPDVLSVFSEQALNQVWAGQRGSHLSLEDALEGSGLKRKGDRRDQTGGGARTYKAWLSSLGLIFAQKDSRQVYLTLAGEAIMNGESPVRILTSQILKYQFPSSFSLGRGVQVNPRFRIHPFWFLLKLLMDIRIKYLTQDEIAKIIIVEAENESHKCYEHIVDRITSYRSYGDKCLAKDFFQQYKPSKGSINLDHPYSHLEDTANTLINWLEYTQFIMRENGRIFILDEKRIDVMNIIRQPIPFISRPEEHEYFQRRYGLDPHHKKDTRNLSQTRTITAMLIAEQRIKREFLSCALKEPIGSISSQLIDKIAENTGINTEIVNEVLSKNYPHGAIGGFLSNYFEMAFKGREKCRDFEESTANIFRNVFKFDAIWLGSAWSGQEVPDVLIKSPDYNFQAIIDTKAYSRYELPSIHQDRMIYHYLPEISRYSKSSMPIGFFSYIAGGFSNSIASPIKKVVNATGINGSALTVANFIKMTELHAVKPYTHEEIKDIFSLNRKITLADIEIYDTTSLIAAEEKQVYDG